MNHRQWNVLNEIAEQDDQAISVTACYRLYRMNLLECFEFVAN